MSEAASLELCPYCHGAATLDIRKPSSDRRYPDGWSRISCWNDACDSQPTTGWFRDDKGNTVEARWTWKLIAKRSGSGTAQSRIGGPVIFEFPEEP